jgi:hypothetical protein
MANTAMIRDAYGVPAMFVASKTGGDDVAFVFVRVGDEERRMRWAGCASRMVWREAFLGRQTLMPSRSEPALAGAIDLRLTITLADGRS